MTLAFYFLFQYKSTLVLILKKLPSIIFFTHKISNFSQIYEPENFFAEQEYK